MANITINTPPTSGVQFIGPRPTVFAGAPVIVQAPATVNRGLDRHQLSSMKALSIVQIICGALSILFDILLIATSYSGIGSGIWCGLFFLIAGILGVVGAAQNRKSLLVATMVMSILSSVILFVIIGIMGGMISYCNSYRQLRYGLYCFTEQYAFGSLLIVTSIVELIVSIWASVLCCKGVCEVNTQLGPNYASQPVYYVQQSMGNQVTVMPQTGFTVTQSPAFMPAGQQNVNHAYYPQQQYAAGNTNYAAGAAGPPPYSS